MEKLHFLVDFKESILKYNYLDKTAFSSHMDYCPVCEGRIREDYHDVENGMTLEFRYVCDACSFCEFFAYGNYVTSFDGSPVPDDTEESECLLAILRKLLFFKLTLSPEEELMVEILLEGKGVSEEGFEQLQKKIAEENHQVKGIESTVYFKQNKPYEEDSYDNLDLDEMFSQLEPLDF